MAWAIAAADRLFRIRYRLLLVNALVVAVPIFGISFARFYEREMLRSLEGDMVHQAQLLRELLVDDPSGPRLAGRSRALRAAARSTRTRIRLLSPGGRVLSDSHGREHGERLDSRVEVRRALEGDYGAATRLRGDRSKLELFAALPIRHRGALVGVVHVTRSTDSVKRAMYRLRTALFWILLGSLLVTVVLSLFFAATISRPLARLTQTATAIARGDTTRTLALGRRDEIGVLARAIERMKIRLDERARYTAELSANICHELKSPLTSMRGAAELLADGAVDDPPARAMFLRNIIEDTERLDRLVTRLLELARIEADPAPVEWFDYAELTAELVARRRSVRFVCEATTTSLRARRSQLASVLDNLLDNAAQHARTGTAIEVRVRDGQRGLVTEVTNVGEPIPARRRADIWRRFFTTRAKQGGTGLGLSIVRSVVEGHGGSVRLDCAGERTTFAFELPLDYCD